MQISTALQKDLLQSVYYQAKPPTAALAEAIAISGFFNANFHSFAKRPITSIKTAIRSKWPEIHSYFSAKPPSG